MRKGLEAGLTVGLETVWTKRRILTVYLNIAEFRQRHVRGRGGFTPLLS
ncbi:transglycosylase domain-containing protein [Pantoea ananatis]